VNFCFERTTMRRSPSQNSIATDRFSVSRASTIGSSSGATSMGAGAKQRRKNKELSTTTDAVVSCLASPISLCYRIGRRR
jgi:hypothetical protein